MGRYSVFSIIKNGLSGNLDWKPTWRSPEPKPAYDVIIVGGGGHTLLGGRGGADHSRRR